MNSSGHSDMPFRGPLLALPVLGLLLLLVSAAAAGNPVFEVTEQDADEIVVHVRLKDFALNDLEADGISYKTITGSEFVTLAEPGQPDLPGYSQLIALPPGGDATLVSVDGAFETVATGIRIAPVESPDTTFRGEYGLGSFIYIEDPGIYGAGGPFPRENVRVERLGRMRHQDVARLTVNPFSYNPVTGTLRAARDFTLRIRLEAARGGAMREGALERGITPPPDAWRGVYDKVLLNPEQAARWRLEKAPRAFRQAVVNDRVKIEISTTGIYKVTYAALSATGFPPDLPVDEIFVYRDEFAEGDPDTILLKEASILLLDKDTDGVFDGQDEIVFYARNFYDEFGARWSQDRFFDKNVYWVSWGSGEHARMAEVDGWPDLESPSHPDHYTHRIHLEEDLRFVQFPPHESADWYYWESFSLSVPFEVSGIVGAYPAELRVNFIGYLVTGATATDEVVLSLTGCSGTEQPVDTVDYWIPGMRNFTVNLEPGILCEGENTFKFKAGVTTNPGTCLDWFEVTYQRRYEASDDFLIFTSGDSLGEIEIELSGFSESGIEVFDITDPYAVERLVVPAENIVEDGGLYSLTFRDSISDTTYYAAVTPGAFMELESSDLEFTTAPLLRTTPGNYLIICHPDFAGALQPLIEQKESQGHTVVFGTTDQVYDDFNNGMKSDEAVKRFIEYGFYAYGAEFALLVGDANVDRRGLLVDDPVDPSDVDYVSSHAFLKRDRQGANYEIWPTQMWFVMVDGPEDRLPDLFIGRLSVGSLAEIEGAVQKIITFEDYGGSDPWKRRILCIADDQYGRDSQICYTGQAQFMNACDSVAVIATDNAIVSPDTIKYYLERCTKYDQPEKRCPQTYCCTTAHLTMSYTRFNCTPGVEDLLNMGSLMVNFQGHANENVFTHETLIREDISENDILDLTNNERPFVFMGYGCYIANFHRFRERQPYIQDCIGEKFMNSPNGAGSASFASTCAEPISGNERFNPFVTHAMFDYLVPYDLHGNPLPARVLAGEVTLTALLRYGSFSYIDQHVLFGDPAMIIDMGPPLMSTAVNDSIIDDTYVFEGAGPGTLSVLCTIKDDEAIMSTGIDLVETQGTIDIPDSEFTETALSDSGYVRSRSYELAYDHVPRLGNYTVRITATDYAGHEAVSEFGVNTGTVEYYKDAGVLEEGGTVVIGQTLRVVISRPVPFAEDDIEVRVDTIPTVRFDEYRVEMKDAEGKEWEVSFIPELDAGSHTIFASVQGLESRRGFAYVPGDVDFFVDGRPLYEDDFVSTHPVLEVLVKGTTDPEEVGVLLDGEAPDSVWYEPDSSETALTVGLSPVLGVGEHELAVGVEAVAVTRIFRVSDELALRDVSAYPVPFGDFVYFYYTLTMNAAEVRLQVFTVSGRKILDDGMLTTYAGYNTYRWNGRDSAGDEIANGTYIYKFTVKSGSGQEEFTAPIARLR
jgi:hypothetical protein